MREYGQPFKIVTESIRGLMPNPTVLLIDADPAIHQAFDWALQEAPNLRLLSAESAGQGLSLLPIEPPAVVVLEVRTPNLVGLGPLVQLRRRDPLVPVLVIGQAGTTETVIEAMKLGAFDYLTRPLDMAQVRDLIGRALETSRAARTEAPASLGLRGEPGLDESLIGQSPAMQEVFKAIGRVAPRDVTVLIQGESGTGKELIARALYRHSRRAGTPFLALNCAAIPENLLESELFGHEQGAFTGADRRRLGKFEQCSGGTLLLDEIGDMTPLTQSKVLRVIQEQRFERVGGNETIRADVRLIAATHHHLARMVQEGRFRDDLFYRLSVFTIHLPPLRERLDDLPILVDHFARRFCRELDKQACEATPEFLEVLQRHAWPGNIRELQSVLKQAILRSHGPVLLPNFLPPLSSPPTARGPEPESAGPGWAGFVDDRLQAGSTSLYDEALAKMEREVIGRVLRHTGGNQVQAAKILGITRGTLRTKIRTLGIPLDA
ncbi:sigma-54 dependent transcriptional regulator [soil metagenome]